MSKNIAEVVTRLDDSILIICGISGSGKSTLEANLIREFPHLFNKWVQFTTRAMREGEAEKPPYIFADQKTFDKFAPLLVGRILPKTAEGSAFVDFKASYGSIPVFKKGMINTVILAEEGMVDLAEAFKDGRIDTHANVFVIALDIKEDDIGEDARREHRDENFLVSEKAVIRAAQTIFGPSSTHVYHGRRGKYIDPEEVFAALLKNGFLQIRRTEK